ncbi:hypothetical protein DV737_g3577, partial [Chaetothyriales sp. CBS 132003]
MQPDPSPFQGFRHTRTPSHHLTASAKPLLAGITSTPPLAASALIRLRVVGAIRCCVRDEPPQPPQPQQLQQLQQPQPPQPPQPPQLQPPQLPQQQPLPPAVTQYRPPFAQPKPPFRSDTGSQPGARASPINAQSPAMLFSSPSPQSFSPQSFSPQFSQPPAAKRPRLSPDSASPFHPPSQPQTPVGQTAGPAGGAALVNGGGFGQTQPSSMPPPQRRAERERERERERPERFENDVMRMSGIDVDQEAQNLAASNMYPRAAFQSRPVTGNSVGAGASNVTAPPGASGRGGQQANGHEAEAAIPEPTAEERQERLEARADWEASRHRQFPLWDMFLYGGPLNDRIREKSQQERLHDPQAGVLVNTQRTGPPPRARVNGFEGATREIDKGQAILDSGAKGERLREIMSIISLATKTRLTGLLNASARLASERREHSKGQAPAEWAGLAVASTGMKRAHGAPPRASGPADVATEESRRAKRAKRKGGTAGAAADTPGTPDVAAMEAAVAAESTQKMTKKAQKEIAGRAAEQVAHASANEAARLAISGMMGSRFGGKKNRTYDWLTAGKSGSSTPTRGPSIAAGPLAGTPNKEPGIQVRDILLVLESDARAPKTYLKALEKIKD